MALPDLAAPAPGRLRVARFESAADLARWDAYVLPRTATITDLAAWRRVLAQAYGIEAHFLGCERDGALAGALALFEIRHPLFGHYLTTAPFGNDGGFHHDDDAARDALLDEAAALAARRRVRYLVIRTREPVLPGLTVQSAYQAAVLDLEGGADAVWARLPSKTRNQVRRGQKEGFTLARGPGELGAFFDVFHRHMRDLGSPAHARRFHEAIAEHLGDRAEFLVVRDGRALVAGALLFQVNGTAMNLHTVALRQYNRRCPNYLVYWEMIQRSCAAGARWFDMGRSRVGSPQMQFKANWGVREVPLHYHFLLRGLAAPPDLDPRNPSFRLATTVWQRLPVALTRLVGPRLITGLA